MRQRIIGMVLAAVVALIIATPVMAAYYSTISVTESGGTSYDMLAVSASMDIEYMADNNFIAADGRDVRVKTIGGADVPFMLVDDKVLFAGEIDNDITNQFRFSTGNSLLTNFDIVVGDGGYITTADHANLEPSNNFEIEYDGYIDTSVDFPTVADTASSAQHSAVTTHTVDMPDRSLGDLLLVFFGRDGDGDLCTFPAGWTELYDNNILCIAYRISSGGTTPSISVTTSGSTKSAHSTLAISGAAGAPVLSSVQSGSSANPNSQSLTMAYTTDILWLSSFAAFDNTSKTLTDVPTNYGNEVYTEGGTDYSFVYSCFARRDYNALTDDPSAFTISGVAQWLAFTVGIYGKAAIVSKEDSVVVYQPDDNEIEATIDQDGTPKTVTATGVTSGDYNIKAGADATDLYIKIDDSTEDSETLSGASAPDNANDWIITPIYLNYYKLTTASTLRLTYQPDDIITGTTLINAESAGTYDGTITYGTTPAGVVVTTSGLETTAASYPVDAGGTTDIIRPTMPALFDVNLERLAANPLQPIVAIIATGINLTERLVWLAGAFVILFILAILVLDKSEGDLAMTFFSCAGWSLIMYFVGIFMLWPVVVLAIAGIASLVYEKVIAL